MTPGDRARDLGHCGRCGAQGLGFNGFNRYECASCGWRFYRNAAAAVFAILECDSRVLLVRRGRDPAAGTLDLPGGFVDLGESAESALARELDEELGVVATAPRYFASYPNVYPYGGVTYDTLDLCFVATLDRPPDGVDGDEISEFLLYEPRALPLDSIAFDSVRSALRAYMETAI